MRSLLMIVVVLAPLALAACDRSPSLVGRYEAVHEEGSGARRPIVVGTGRGRTGRLERRFRIHLLQVGREGKGALAAYPGRRRDSGRVVGRELVVDMPGVGRLVFRRAERQ
jgi:hypothetical protein